MQLRDVPLADQLDRIFNSYLADAREIRQGEIAPWPQRLLDAFARLLSPML